MKAKPVFIGPVTYLGLGKAKDGASKLALLPRLLVVYAELLETLAAYGVEWVQIDEPLLVTELAANWQHAFNTAYHQLKSCRVKLLLQHKVLSLGVINGSNIWKTDLSAVLDWVEPTAAKRGGQLWIAPSCSLLHVPVDLASEQKLDPELKSWLAYALQKLDELKVLATALNQGREAVRGALAAHHNDWFIPSNGGDSPSTQPIQGR